MSASSEENNGLKQEEDEESVPGKSNPFFHFMLKYPLPFLIILPVAFAFLIGFGWTVDERVENKVANIWIPQDGDYARDQEYARGFGADDLGASTFAALSVSRDNGNIMTADRLEEIRARMEATENTTIIYKDVEYTWDDLCAVNQAPYQFPCLRLSPMDLFQEARWTFTPFDRAAWYLAIQNGLVSPRLPRFGVMTQDCRSECFTVLLGRAANPLALFADIGNMEMNHQCRMCIEQTYDEKIAEMHALIQPTFRVLSAELQRYSASLGEDDDAKKAELDDIAEKLDELASSVTTADVAEFYKYLVLRGLYSELGARGYVDNYALFDPLIEACQGSADALGLNCPSLSSDVSEDAAKQALLDHADGPFSPVNGAGAPFPFWSDAAAGGSMFGQNDDGSLFAVSGSGIDMSGEAFSTAVYVDAANYGDEASWSPAFTQDGFADPESQQWQTLVAVDPVYAWFMASLTPADEGTVCANEPLPGTDTASDEFDAQSSGAAMQASQSWCTPFNVPNPMNPGPPGTDYSKQHFAKMWYDLLISSPGFLDVKQGEDDPYSWTNGAGCGYSLGGSRFSYTNQSDEDILLGASREVFNIDEGTSLGPVDRNLLIGGSTPGIGEYDQENPLSEVRVLQSIYAALLPTDLIQRVKNCNRPGGAVDITIEDAEEILYRYKEAMEESWVEGWDDDQAGEVQFVGFFDDSGDVVGSTGRMLEDISLDNSRLTAIAIVLIAVFSAICLFSFDLVESRILITLIGVSLVVASYFAALGFSLLLGIKINVSIAWTLPFVIIGLGVDDVYIILLALKQQRGYTNRNWLDAMHEVAVPVTMTSLMNTSMFAILNVSDIPAVYLTARVACYCVVALYLSVMFCFPAYCYYDMKRQEEGRADVIFCVKSETGSQHHKSKDDFRQTILYDSFYKKLVFSANTGLRSLVHAVVIALALATFAIGIWGIQDRSIGLGLEDFFPKSNPAGHWAELRTEELASWSIGIRWGQIDYSNPSTQMRMIKQFEDVVESSYVSQIDTKQLWMADFAIWTTNHCTENFDRQDFQSRECGADQEFSESDEVSTCSGTWVPNDYGLRVKNIRPLIDDTCTSYEGGICRPAEQMFESDLENLGLTLESAANQTFCPVIEDWSDDKWVFCLTRWRNITGSGANFLTEADTATPKPCDGVFYNDADLVYPIPMTFGPSMFAFDLFSHDDTLNMIKQTRAICDDDEEIHCWMTGIPYDYWSQYEEVFPVLVELGGYAAAAGFVIAFFFLLGTFLHGGHPLGKSLGASLIGSLLILVTIIFTLIPVVGLSSLIGVNLTGFSMMSFVLSVGFAVEYSVHTVSRWMRASNSITTSVERVEHAMEALMLPTFMAFVSSTIGVICLAFTEFDFNLTFFFKPLLIVMFVTYFMGCWFVPVILCYLDFEMLRMGDPSAAEAENNDTDKDGPENASETNDGHNENDEKETQEEEKDDE